MTIAQYGPYRLSYCLAHVLIVDKLVRDKCYFVVNTSLGQYSDCFNNVHLLCIVFVFLDTWLQCVGSFFLVK